MSNNNRFFSYKIKNLERKIILIFYILIVFSLSWILYYKNLQSQYGDTTFAAQILFNFRHGLNFDSSFAESTNFSINNIWYRTSDFVCKSPLVTPGGFTWFHFYFIAYLLGFVSRFFDIYWFIAVSHSLIYSSILLFVYVLARKYKINILNSILLVLITTQHPLWSQGLFGQFYFNRFFMLFCAAILFLISNKNKKYFLIALFCLLAITTNEIYGVALFMIFTIYWFLFDKDKKLLFFGFVSLVTSAVLILLIQKIAGPHTTQTGMINLWFSGGLSGIFLNLKDTIFSTNSGLFLLINFVFGGIFIFFNPKFFIAWIFLLIPNLLSYVGKLGWSTHYHASYFVPILWILVYVLSKYKFKNKIVLTSLLTVYFLSLTFFDFDKLKIRKPIITFLRLRNDISVIFLNKNKIANKFNMLQSSVAPVDKISLPEAIAYPFLDHKIFYYPMDVDNVDKVILFYNKNETGDKRFMSVNYGQQDSNLDSCILSRMRSNNFDLDNPKILGDFAIIGRK